MDIKRVLQSRDVLRYHNHSGIDKQLMSDHQWGVAMIVYKIHPHVRGEVIMAALTHDVSEYVTGDIPAPVKWKNPSVKALFDELEEEVITELGIKFNLTQEEQVIIKIADMMEGMWYCVQQMKEGNQSARRPFRLWREAVIKKLQDDKRSLGNAWDMVELLDHEKAKWDISRGVK